MTNTMNQQTINLYVKAVELAKQKDGLGNQDKMLLNRFKILCGAERKRMLDEGKQRADVAEAYLLSQLKSQGMISD